MVSAIAIPYSWLIVRDLVGGRANGLAVVLPLGLGALALLAAVAALAWKPGRLPFVAFAISCIVAAAVFTVGPWIPRSDAAVRDPVRIAVANLLFDSAQPEEGADDARATDADVLVIPEATPATIAELQATYEFVAVDPVAATFRTAVFSRDPIRVIDTTTRTVTVEVDSDTPFTLFAVHLRRPDIDGGFPAQQRAIDALDDAVNAVDGPTVIAGDLNLSDRAPGYRGLVNGRTDAVRTSWAAPTFGSSWYHDALLLRIDHIFVSDDWCATGGGRFTITGSDHRGVVADVGPCA